MSKYELGYIKSPKRSLKSSGFFFKKKSQGEAKEKRSMLETAKFRIAHTTGYQCLHLIILLVFTSQFMVSCENDENEVRALNEKKIMVEEARNVVSFFSQEGKMKAKLSAPIMLRYEADSSYIEFPKTLHVDFYDTTGKKESELSCLYGKYMESSHRVLLRDSVVVASIKGDTLRTSELWWNQDTHKFYTDKLVRLKTVDKYIYGGKGLEAEEDLSLWTIFEPKGTATMPEEMAP